MKTDIPSGKGNQHGKPLEHRVFLYGGTCQSAMYGEEFQKPERQPHTVEETDTRVQEGRGD